MELLVGRRSRYRQCLRPGRPARQETSQALAPLQQVAGLLAVKGRTVERRLHHVLVRQRHAEARAEVAQLLFVERLLLVGDVAPLARLAEAVALHRLRQDHRGRALVAQRRGVGRVHFLGIVPAPCQTADLVVTEMVDHLQQLRMGAEEVLPGIAAGGHDVLLVVAVHRLLHPLREEPLGVGRQQRVPVRPPDHLDDVPAGAPEHRLQFLDDLAVAAHRPVQPLQVAVDHPDEVVEVLARRQRESAGGLGLVGLAVAHETPYARLPRQQPPGAQVAGEARLVDGHDGRQPHGHRRELPEVGHEMRMGVGRQSAPLGQLLPEEVELARAHAVLHVGARIVARRRMALEIDQVAGCAVVATAQEVVEGDLVEVGGGGIGGDVSADARLQTVGLDHHGHGVPAHVALHLPLDAAVAGIRRFLLPWDGVEVRRVQARLGGLLALADAGQQLREQRVDPLGPLAHDLTEQRLEGIQHPVVGPRAGCSRARLGHGARLLRRRGVGRSPDVFGVHDLQRYYRDDRGCNT